MWYRVSPDAANPRVGDELMVFKGLPMALTYVLGWYGDHCSLYEMEGGVVETHQEQVDLGTRHNGPVLQVDCATIKVETWNYLGKFEWKKREGVMDLCYTPYEEV